MKASALGRLLGVELEGGTDPEITGAAPLDHAGPSDLSFVAKARYLPYVARTRAGLLLVAAELADRVQADARLVVDDVHAALAVVLPELYPEPESAPGIDPTAQIDESATLGRDVSVGPYAVVGPGVRIGERARIGAHVVIGGGCELGPDVVLHPHVTLYRRVRIGARSIVHAGVRLGVDGYGYAAVDGRARKIPQVGDCVIGADVEIGANTTIDRGSIGTTRIGDGVKIDNLVHIGHNVTVGDGSLIIAQVGISGSAQIGAGVTLAGQAGLAGHIQIGDGATIAGQSGVFGDVPAGAVYSGYPARPHQEALRAQASLLRLPRLWARLRELERQVRGRGSVEGV